MCSRCLRTASRDHGQSIAMVTHDPVAASYADRVLFLADGALVHEIERSSADRDLRRDARPGARRVSARDQLREHRPSILVAGLGTTFGVGLLTSPTCFEQVVASDAASPRAARSRPCSPSSPRSSSGLALYVGAIVTANTFATVVAGRTPTIALMRLLGSSARDQRRAVAARGARRRCRRRRARHARSGSALVVVAVRSSWAGAPCPTSRTRTSRWATSSRPSPSC